VSSTSSDKTGREKAVALKYDKADAAPRVVASGMGELAKRILKLAEEHKIPVTRDDSLVEILSKLNLGMEIPPETYRVVAEILAFLYKTDEKWRLERGLIAVEMITDEKGETLPDGNTKRTSLHQRS
jgi:flagellar biosynthesis protein